VRYSVWVCIVRFGLVVAVIEGGVIVFGLCVVSVIFLFCVRE